MYEWRKASPDERARMLRERKLKGQPWHTPPHLEGSTGLYHICAACYEHEPYIGTTPDRLQNFSQALLETLGDLTTEIFAWCVLPNHYHAQLHMEASKSWASCMVELHSNGMNYIHHHPVKHGLVQKWQEWPFSSAREYLDRVGREKARDIWFKYPVKDYGNDWLGTDL